MSQCLGPGVTMGSREDHALARTIAAHTGEALVALRRESGGMEPRDLGDEADRVANAIILRALEANIARGDGVLSEEHPDDSNRLMRDRVWIVDPLDGTREFAQSGRTDWAVHIGLSIDNVATVGAVALPAMAMVVSTGEPPPAVRPPRSSRVRLAVSRTRPPEVTGVLEERLGCEVVAMGSAGAKAMAVVRGEVDAYVHAGGQYEWDSCAPVAVASATGLHASRLDGSPLRYNMADPYLPDLLICRPELAEPILQALG